MMQDIKKIKEEREKGLFSFTRKNEELSKKLMGQYPKGKQASAVLGLLHLAQEQLGGWVSSQALAYIANLLDMPLMRIYEVVTFYPMFYLEPNGERLIQVCTTTPCWLRGSDEVCEAFKKSLHVSLGETTEDKMFTLKEVGCLGACPNAPVVQINETYYEQVHPKDVPEILNQIRLEKKKS